MALTRDSGGLVGCIPASHLDWTGVSAGVPGLFYHYVVARYRARVELYFKTSSADENKRRFDRIFEQREQIEGAFGQPLTWERLDGKTACRVRLDIRLREPRIGLASTAAGGCGRHDALGGRNVAGDRFVGVAGPHAGWTILWTEPTPDQ